MAKKGEPGGTYFPDDLAPYSPSLFRRCWLPGVDNGVLRVSFFADDLSVLAIDTVADTATLRLSPFQIGTGPPIFDGPGCLAWQGGVAFGGGQIGFYRTDVAAGSPMESMFAGNFDQLTWDGEAMRVHVFVSGSTDKLGFIRVAPDGKQLTKPGDLVPISEFGEKGYRVSTDPVSGRTYYVDHGPDALYTRAYERDGTLIWSKTHAPIVDGFDHAIAGDGEGAWIFTRRLTNVKPWQERIFRVNLSGELTLYAGLALPDGEQTGSERAVFSHGPSDAWFVVPTTERTYYAELKDGVLSTPRVIVESGLPVLKPGQSDLVFDYLALVDVAHAVEVGGQKWVVLGEGRGVRALRVDDPTCVYPSMKPYPGGPLPW